MMSDTEQAVDTPSVIDVANNILAFLAAKAADTPDWEAVIKSMMETDKVDAVTKAVATRRDAAGFGDPVGAISTGMGILKDDFGLASATNQAAIAALKNANRLIQAGAGRWGKCLIILSDKPLSEGDDVVLAPAPKTIKVKATNAAATVVDDRATAVAQGDPAPAYADTFNLLEGLRQSVEADKAKMDELLVRAKKAMDPEREQKLLAEIAGLTADKSSLTRQVGELQTQLATKEDAVRKLETALAERTVATWM